MQFLKLWVLVLELCVYLSNFQLYDVRTKPYLTGTFLHVFNNANVYQQHEELENIKLQINKRDLKSGSIFLWIEQTLHVSVLFRISIDMRT